MSDPTYSLRDYGKMIADEVRMAAYDAAIRATCRPGSRVLDIGSGPGLLSLLACRYGAARVYALEASDVIAVAKEIAAANELSDRIVFMQQMSTAVTLPEPVDVVIADVRGVLPMTGTSLATMRDARRFLTPEGIIVPARDRLRVALVQAEAAFTGLVAPWEQHARGFDLRPARLLLLQNWRRVQLPAEALLTEPCTLIELEYATIDRTSAEGSCTVPIERAGTAHGICGWFDTTLHGEIGFSNEPGQPPTIYGQALFPLGAPVPVVAGDTATLSLRAAHVHDGYVWIWEATIRSADGRLTHHGRHSTFHGVLLSRDTLHEVTSESVPRG